MDPRRIEFGVFLPAAPAGLRHPPRARAVCRSARLPHRVVLRSSLPAGHAGRPGFEGWTLVSALAALTQRIRLGQLVICNGFRHPAVLAKMAITLDVISGGRLDLGLGSGSYRHRVRGIRPAVPRPRYAQRAARRGARGDRAPVYPEARELRGEALPAAKRSGCAVSGPEASSADHDRRGRRAPHAAARRAARRCLELSDLLARPDRAQARRDAARVREAGARPGDARVRTAGRGRARGARVRARRGDAHRAPALRRRGAGASTRAASSAPRRA